MLASDLAQIGSAGRVALGRRLLIGSARWDVGRTAGEDPQRALQVGSRRYLDLLDERRPPRLASRQHQPGEAGLRGGQRHGEGARRRPDLAVERELAEEGMACQTLAGGLAARGKE